MSNKHVFSEQEAGEILRRAVHLQEKSASSTYTPGITQEELERIANEAGIDAGFLAKAIAGQGDEEKSTTGLFNMTEEFERVVDGEMDPANFDTISNMVKRNGRSGLVQVGRTLAGQGFSGIHMVTVNVEARKGRTKIRVKYLPFSAYFIGLHLPIIASFGLIGGMAGAGMVWLGVGIAATLLAVGGAVFSAIVRAGRKAAKKLTGEIVERVEDETAELRSNLSHASLGETKEEERVTDKA